VRLLKRLIAELPEAIRLRTEVPIRAPGDLRSWDAELRTGSTTCKLEAETVLSDIQALDRRIGRKMADDEVQVVILLVADTLRNRAALREAAPLLETRFSLSTRQVMAPLRAGHLPSASGIVIL
jgi:hypothetical protein